jgi:hypothetical protein
VAVARGVADGFADDADEEGSLFRGGGGEGGVDGEFAFDAEAGFEVAGEGVEGLGEGEVGGAGAGEEVGDFAGALAGFGEGVFEGAEALGGGRGALGDLFAEEGGEAGAADEFLAEGVVEEVAEAVLLFFGGAEGGGGGALPFVGACVEGFAEAGLGAFALGDVGDGEEEASGDGVAGGTQRRPVEEPEGVAGGVGSVFAGSVVVVAGEGGELGPACEEGGDRAVGGGVDGEAEEAARGGVAIDDVAVAVGDDQAWSWCPRTKLRARGRGARAGRG